LFIEDAVSLMRMHKIRRLVVVNRDGLISGVITSDDILNNFEAFSKEQAFDFIKMSRGLREHRLSP
jgi:CBS domain-containing protein